MRNKPRLPLRRDEKLWEAFKEDREAAALKRARRKNAKRPDNCQGPCGRPLRPTHTYLEDYPDTVRHRGHGVCEACTTKSKKETAS